MNKKDIKSLLISMRTTENEKIVNNLLGKIDLLADEKIELMVNKIGDSEESIRNYLQTKIEERQQNIHKKHTPINDMFTYGISGKCIHLHMPVDLHEMISEKGMSKTIDTVNLQLLDAIERIRKLQNEGYYQFQGKDSIFMISPILVGREMKFLDQLDFKTRIYKKKELQDSEFVNENTDAKLATDIFGNRHNIGTASIELDVVNSDEWQEKKNSKVKEFEEQGSTLDTEKEDINK